MGQKRLPTTKEKQDHLQIHVQSSKKLIQCLTDLGKEQLAAKESPQLGFESDAKIELLMISNELMPHGSPNLLGIRKYPFLFELVEEFGKRKVLALLAILIKDFCSSINVVRNMNEDQIIESASMLLNDANNFRMEDFVLMFTMAKKGLLDVKIMDRLDIQVISAIFDDYFWKRKKAGDRKIDESMFSPERNKNLSFNGETYVEQESMGKKVTNLAGMVSDLTSKLKSK